MKVICIVGNLYSLLIFLLIKNIELKKIMFIIEDKHKDLRNKFDKVILVKKYKNKYFNFLNKIKYFIYFSILEIIYGFRNADVYGNDHITGAFYFLRKHNFFVIEDGCINYNSNIYEHKYKKNFFSFPAYGQYKTVKKIYLTKKNVPNEIKEKVEIIDLKKLWENKTLAQKKEILKIFDFNDNIVQKIKKKKNILFTQPLSEDGAITEKEKIDLYSKIIRKYDNEKLVIKKHPREKTDYKEIFNNILVIEESFPAEIFDFLDIKFEKIITIFSTAALNLSQDINIDFYGTEVEDKLLRYFGSFENVMKRNSYL